MANKKRILTNLSWGFFSLVFFVLVSFVSKKSTEVELKDVKIEVKYPKNQTFITSEEIFQIIEKEVDTSLIDRLEEINISQLEETIDNQNFIKKSEVFSTLDGTLFINVLQKEAMARVFEGNKSYYLDTDGRPMPLSPHFSASVPYVWGYPNSTDTTALLKMLQCIQSDDFNKEWISGIKWDSSLGFVLFPRVGKHSIIYGDTSLSDKKWKKLKIFYSNLQKEKAVEGIKTIDLRFEGQVVTKKW